MNKQINGHHHSPSSSFNKSAPNTIEGLSSTNLGPVFEKLETINQKVDAVLARVNGAVKSHHTVEEVAQLTGRSPYTVRRWISEELISATRIADTGPRGRLLIAHGELEKLINCGRGAAVPPAAVGFCASLAKSGS